MASSASKKNESVSRSTTDTHRFAERDTGESQWPTPTSPLDIFYIVPFSEVWEVQCTKLVLCFEVKARYKEDLDRIGAGWQNFPYPA